MNILNDETLNKYLDGELSQEEIIEVERIVNSSPESKLRLMALKEVDRSLRNMTTPEVGFDITTVIMQRIQWNEKSKKKQKRFIIIVSSVFILLSLSIAGFLGFEIIRNYNPGSSKTITDTVKYAKTVTDMITGFLNNTNMTIVGGVFSFGLLLSAYFFFDYSKVLRKASK
jgi:hypothetical protein